MKNFPDEIIGQHANLLREITDDDPRIEDGETLANILDGSQAVLQRRVLEALRTGQGLIELAVAHYLLSTKKTSSDSKE